MDPIRTIQLHWVTTAPGEVAYHLSRFRFAQPLPTWQPAVNVYRCEGCVRVCVDLAGVARADIDLRVEAKRMVIRGTRNPPERSDDPERALQMLVMEIDYGPFERSISLPDAVEVEKAHAEQENGLLWISLPLKR
jgi:HSP20 family protein